MLKNFSKRLAFIIALTLMIISPMNVFANELQTETQIPKLEMKQDDYSVALSNSNSFTLELPHNMAANSKLAYMGFNPTVKVTAKGNPNMIFCVWVINPAGISGDVGYVRGDGSTISKNLWMSIGGNYHVYVQPWEGTTNGKSAYFDFEITW